MLRGRPKVETLSSMLGLARSVVVERSTIGYLIFTLQSLDHYPRLLSDYLDTNAEPQVPPEDPVMVHMLYSDLW